MPAAKDSVAERRTRPNTVLERRGLNDRRAGEDRRVEPDDGPVARVAVAMYGERRVGPRRSGADRREPAPAPQRLRRR